jgi:hypothetical protein
VLHGVRFVDPDQRQAVAQRVADLAAERSLKLTPPDLHHTPSRYLRPDGSSRLHPADHDLYTTQTLLDAEARLLDAGRQPGAPTLSEATVATITEAPLAGKDYGLSLDQALWRRSPPLAGGSTC